MSIEEIIRVIKLIKNSVRNQGILIASLETQIGQLLGRIEELEKKINGNS